MASNLTLNEARDRARLIEIDSYRIELDLTSRETFGCRTTVTGYLMCTDNLPSGSALKLGDVITIHGGTTVEVLNTDAEGRLVMADALVMAAEQRPDAIVDIATLTGACLRALGTKVAGVQIGRASCRERVLMSV